MEAPRRPLTPESATELLSNLREGATDDGERLNLASIGRLSRVKLDVETFVSIAGGAREVATAHNLVQAALREGGAVQQTASHEGGVVHGDEADSEAMVSGAEAAPLRTSRAAVQVFVYTNHVVLCGRKSWEIALPRHQPG